MFALRCHSAIQMRPGMSAHDGVEGRNEQTTNKVQLTKQPVNLDWMRTMWEQMTRGDFVLENYVQFLTARPSILVTDCKSLYEAIHKEGAAPASTDKRSATELAIVKAEAVSGETDLRWIDARYQIADCLTKHV